MITQSKLISVKDYFIENASEYLDIANRLRHIKSLYLSADSHTKRSMWFNSYLFAVLSIQTVVDRHEHSFRLLTENLEIEDYQDEKKIRPLLEKSRCGHYKFKIRAITRTTKDLLAGNINIHITDRSFKKLRKEYKDTIYGLGYIKVSFLMAMLGFRTICIDTWISKYLGLDYYNGASQRLSSSLVYYERIENRIKREAKETISDWSDNPFIYQWVLFDYCREFKPSYHDIFFVQTEKLVID
jgi:hypothetical protein